MLDVTLPVAVLKNSDPPSPMTVDTRLPVLIYPRLPRPLDVDVIYVASVPMDEIYPREPSPCKLEMMDVVLKYVCPRPCVVDVKEAGTTVRVLTYVCPKP